MVRWSDANRTRREVSRFSQKDAESIYPEFALSYEQDELFREAHHRFTASRNRLARILNELGRLMGLVGHFARSRFPT